MGLCGHEAVYRYLHICIHIGPCVGCRLTACHGPLGNCIDGLPSLQDDWLGLRGQVKILDSSLLRLEADLENEMWASRIHKIFPEFAKHNNNEVIVYELSVQNFATNTENQGKCVGRGAWFQVIVVHDS